MEPTGRSTRRWEFMLLPGEDAADVQQADDVWDLLAPWIGGTQGTLIRHTIYRFRSSVADRWQDERFFIMRDASHLMPPFLGQGMCSGIRDAWNLSWKLNLVLGGRADAELLKTYEQERALQVTELTQIAV